MSLDIVQVIVAPTDAELEDFLRMQVQLKDLNARMKVIRDKCKEFGSFCTENHACVVYDQEQHRLVGLEEAVQALKDLGGLDELVRRDMVKVIEFSVVKIASRL